MSEALPWDRQTDEPDDAFKAFVNYREMPMPRRVLSASSMATTRELWEWSSRFLWASRVKQYDDHLSGLAIAERESLVKQGAHEVYEQQLIILAELRQLVQREGLKWLDYSRSMQGPSILKAADFRNLVETTIKLDRLVRGESTENLASGGDMSKLTPDELWKLRELQKKAGL